MMSVLLRLLTILLLLLLSPLARAQQLATPASPPAACPVGNLLAGRKPVAWKQIRGQLTLGTDGVKAPEGALWNAPLALVLDSDIASLTWDLGAAVPVAAVWMQADANDRYVVSGSVDGRTFESLGTIEPVEGHGLRARTIVLPGEARAGKSIRYLRFGGGVGDGYYSLSEIAAYCQMPTPFPPVMKVGNAQAQPAGRSILTYWNNEVSARWELVLALLGFGLLYWGHRLRKQGRPSAFEPLRTRLLAVLGGLAALSFINFGFFHFTNFIHDHEWTHYYLGSKYFPELGYQRLYECITTADVEAGLRQRVAHRTITNLRTNVLEKTDDVLAHPERCKVHFSPARWRDFSHDVAFFRGRMSARGWDDLQFDHGYNATPLWNAHGHFLSNLAPASRTQLYLLAMLDPLFLLGTAAVIWWAFGWRVLAVGLLAFGTNFPSRFYWIGGAFLRYDWLFFLVAGIACLRKRRPALAGAALACAAGLRVFPAFLFLGPLLALVWQWRKRRIDPLLPRFFAAAALAGVLLFGVSLAGSGGVSAYRGFAENTAKHQATGLVNNMGLRTVVAYRPSEVGRLLKDNAIDPWARWKDARLRAWHQAKPVWVVFVLGFVALLALAARHAEPWVLAALGVAFVPFAVELLSYYFAFIIGVAVLVEKRAEIGRWLLALTAFTQFVAWAPLRNMSTWLDDQYTLMSLATLFVFAMVAWRFRRSSGEDIA